MSVDILQQLTPESVEELIKDNPDLFADYAVQDQKTIVRPTPIECLELGKNTVIAYLEDLYEVDGQKHFTKKTPILLTKEIHKGLKDQKTSLQKASGWSYKNQVDGVADSCVVIKNADGRFDIWETSCGNDYSILCLNRINKRTKSFKCFKKKHAYYRHFVKRIPDHTHIQVIDNLHAKAVEATFVQGDMQACLNSKTQIYIHD